MLRVLLCFLQVLPPLLLAAQEDEFNGKGADPGLLMMAMLLLFCFLLTAILFFLIVFVLFLFFYLFTAIAIIPVSFWIGWKQRSIRAGLIWMGRAGFIVMGMGFSMFFSGPFLFLYSHPPELSEWILMICGGALAGWLSFGFCRWSVGFLIAKATTAEVTNSSKTSGGV